jgi:hypothetical protein
MNVAWILLLTETQLPRDASNLEILWFNFGSNTSLSVRRFRHVLKPQVYISG